MISVRDSTPRLPLLGIAIVVASIGVAPAALAASPPRLVSVSSGERQGNGPSGGSLPHTVAVSGDGRFVAFQSKASNLVAGDSNGDFDVFVRDRTTGMTTRASTGGHRQRHRSGGLDPVISGDGRFVAFRGTTGPVPRGYGGHTGVDAFLHDRRTGRTIRVSRRYRGAPRDRRVITGDIAISGNGRFVAYSAVRLIPYDVASFGAFVYDRRTGGTTRIRGIGRDVTQLSLSGDGRRVAFWTRGDRNTRPGMYVRDRSTGRTLRVLHTLSAGEPALSADGRYVAFERFRRGHSVPDLYVRDLRSGRARFAGRGVAPALSRHGGRIAFHTLGRGGVNGDRSGPIGDVYLRAVRSGRTRLVSATRSGRPSHHSGGSALSTDGHVVAFTSSSSDIVAGDTNEASDVFIRRYGKPSGPTSHGVVPRFTG